MTKGENTKVDMMMSMLERHMTNSDKHHETVAVAVIEQGKEIATLKAQQQANVDKITGIRAHGRMIWVLILSLLGINVV